MHESGLRWAWVQIPAALLCNLSQFLILLSLSFPHTDIITPSSEGAVKIGRVYFSVRHTAGALYCIV